MPLAAVLEFPWTSAYLFFAASLGHDWRASSILLIQSSLTLLCFVPNTIILYVFKTNTGWGWSTPASECQQGNHRSCNFNDMEEVTCLEPDSWWSITHDSLCWDYICFCSHLPTFPWIIFIPQLSLTHLPWFPTVLSWLRNTELTLL